MENHLTTGEVVWYHGGMNQVKIYYNIGRQRVLKKRRKNVHAYVRGTLVDVTTPRYVDVKPISYNPYKGPNFMLDGLPIDGTPVVHGVNGKLFQLS